MELLSWLLAFFLCWQFSNGVISKMLAYLGALSIIVCFSSAALSLALAFALIPRQVMPWTGLLLMYEWTFAGFFILFGSFLRLIRRWGRAAGAQPGGAAASHSESEAYDSGKGPPASRASPPLPPPLNSAASGSAACTDDPPPSSLPFRSSAAFL